ncbi:lysophospholipase D GDPD3-like [Polypterus senegalus]|uniref:lysophospholipase D GDPD3-like n=1 Tax=Polypterus senegalus TaxID=55291 RepID=UPI001963EA39|nr:lysophospholipase D GDPD3-like [Polypterus senegalus]
MSNYLYYIVPVLGGYTLTSVLLLRNPHLLHKKKQTAIQCQHISHRGGGGERIENTLEAFTNAVDNGTDLLELDCHLTRDGQVVVSHDENLLRETGHDINISDVDYADLPLYRDRLAVTFYEGHFSTGKDRRIALLEDVLKQFPHTAVNIEIKEDNEPLIKKVSDLVKKYDRESRTVWASVKSDIMKKCRAENPNMPTMFTFQRGLLLLLMYYTGLLPFVPLSESFLQTYMPSIINRTYTPSSVLLRNSFLIKIADKITMRKSLLRHLQQRGIQIHLFVLNEESDFRRAFQLGATGVMTDYPSKLRRYLDSNPMPSLNDQ